MKLAVFGFGNVGRVLSRQALLTGASVTAVADSSGVVVSNAKSFSLGNLEVLSNSKDAGNSLSSAASEADSTFLSVKDYIRHLENDKKATDKLVLTDCSSFADANQYLLPAQAMGIPVALANKKPLSGSLEDFRRITADRDLVRYEATVGAGLPVIISLRRLIDAGDEILSIEGCLSGTLGYLLSALGGDDRPSFSETVVKAHSLGFTEPDPRDDLSGTDVARKALILCRMLGYSIEMEDVSIEKLYSDEMGDLEIDEFMKNLPSLDEKYADVIESAAAEGMQVKYVASIQCDGDGVKVDVGLKKVEKESVLGSLQGTDNCVVFKSKAYFENNLVVRGPGAGLDVTAQGVLADCFDLFGKTINPKFAK